LYSSALTASASRTVEKSVEKSATGTHRAASLTVLD